MLSAETWRKKLTLTPFLATNPQCRWLRRGPLALVLIAAACLGASTSTVKSAESTSHPTETLPSALWIDATDMLLGRTAEWTNRVELADINDDDLIDILFANGGNYSEPGDPELNRVFVNRGRGERFEEQTVMVFGSRPDDVCS